MSWKDATGRFAILIVLVAGMIGFLVFHQHQKTIPAPRHGNATAVSTPTSAEANAVDQVAMVRMARDRVQSMAMQNLRTALSGNGTEPALLATSYQSLQRNMRWQTECEALLRSQGFGQVGIVIDDRRVELVVPYAPTEQQVAEMAALVQRVTGLPYESMTVLPAH